MRRLIRPLLRALAMHAALIAIADKRGSPDREVLATQYLEHMEAFVWGGRK
jgi:hypothetical protein